MFTNITTSTTSTYGNAITYLAELFGWESYDLHAMVWDLHDQHGSWDIERYASYDYLASLVGNYTYA